MPYLIRFSPIKVFVLLLIVSLSASYFFVKPLIKIEYDAKRASAYAVGESQSALISTTISHNMSANYALSSMIRFSDRNMSFFDSYSEELKKLYPLVSHFTLSPQGVIKWVYPLEGNERSIGLNQLSFPQQKKSALLAKISRKLTLAAPVDLIQGGQALIGRWPVWIEQGDEQIFWGFTNVTLKLDDFLEEVKLTELRKQGYHYRLEKVVENDINKFIASSTNHLIQDKDWLDINIHVPNGEWILKLTPKDGWLTNEIFIFDLGIALSLSLLFSILGGLSWRIFLTKQQLEEKVKERTKEVTYAHNRVTSLLDAIPDMLFELDEDNTIVYCHAPSFNLHGFTAESVTGRKIEEILPTDVVQLHYQAFREAKETGYSIGITFSIYDNEKERWFELSVTYAHKNEDFDARYVVVPRDVTVIKAAEVESRIAATAFESHDAVIITDIDKKIIRVNKAFQKITGYSEKEVLGRTTEILDSERHDSDFYEAINSQLKVLGHWEGEVWCRKKDGTIYPELLSISVVYDDLGNPIHHVSISKDITQIKQNEKTINQLSFYDSLTCLPNRTMVVEHVADLLSKRGGFSTDDAVISASKDMGAILFIDLDDFKNINDTKGHPIGDLFLQKVAERLSRCIKNSGMVARFGGDEFIVVLPPKDAECIKLETEGNILQKIHTELSRPILIQGDNYAVSTSIGFATIDENVQVATDVFKNAELAMYEAKTLGKSQTCYYSARMQEVLSNKRELESALRDAIKNDEFMLYYQPQFDRFGHIKGVEALIRWYHPKRGLISPMEFIPLAEESKLIIPIGQWVTRTACLQLKAWQNTPKLKNITISVNVSALQFSQKGFVNEIESILKETEISPDQLQLELTESMLVTDKESIALKMSELKTLGIQFSLDDFGTGYSSLSYLQKLPFDQLKIDQSFVRTLTNDDMGSLAFAIAAMGSSLGLEVIAEGVETQLQLDRLKQCECDLFQGYFTGYPEPAEKLEHQFSDTTLP